VRDGHRLALDEEREGGVGPRVDDAQPHALADTAPAVHHHRLPRRPGLELCQLRLRRQPVEAVEPVVELQEGLLVVLRALGRVLDDQRTLDAGVELQARVRVVEERAGVGRPELVHEAISRSYGGLGHPGNAVHGVGEPDAAPVKRRALRQVVLDRDPYLAPAPHAHHRSGQPAIEEPGLSAPAAQLDRPGAARKVRSTAPASPTRTSAGGRARCGRCCARVRRRRGPPAAGGGAPRVRPRACPGRSRPARDRGRRRRRVPR
jgi:hypothetical protein